MKALNIKKFITIVEKFNTALDDSKLMLVALILFGLPVSLLNYTLPFDRQDIVLVMAHTLLFMLQHSLL